MVGGRAGEAVTAERVLVVAMCHSSEQPKIEKNKFPFWGP